ncbi:MAG TPA: hypothetical protein VIR31_07815 [Nitrososphaeraceae archaeon]
MKLQDIDRIEIEGIKVTIFNKDDEAIASSEYTTKERAIEVANDIFNQKIKAVQNG